LCFCKHFWHQDCVKQVVRRRCMAKVRWHFGRIVDAVTAIAVSVIFAALITAEMALVRCLFRWVIFAVCVRERRRRRREMREERSEKREERRGTQKNYVCIKQLLFHLQLLGQSASVLHEPRSGASVFFFVACLFNAAINKTDTFLGLQSESVLHFGGSSK
jgi:hypothetical protein